jgi:hypothetical protein
MRYSILNALEDRMKYIKGSVMLLIKRPALASNANG